MTSPRVTRFLVAAFAVVVAPLPAAAQVFLHQRTQHIAEQHRRRLEVELDQPIADQRKDRRHGNVERRVVD